MDPKTFQVGLAAEEVENHTKSEFQVPDEVDCKRSIPAEAAPATELIGCLSYYASRGAAQAADFQTTSRTLPMSAMPRESLRFIPPLYQGWSELAYGNASQSVVIDYGCCLNTEPADR